jgi:4-carboxymuconolactone decarboxylase
MATISASCPADRLTDRQHQEDIVTNEMFERGLEIRKSVLGKEFVEKSISSADDFNRPMQELVTEYCWGAVWGRDGLPKKTRSMLNLAMLCALNRPHELRMHLAGALRNGVTRDEIREVLLQVAIYCGVPAGVDAFRNAREVFAEIDGAKAKS